MMMMSKIIVIVGPTASGKTRLSIELAHKYNAVIMNADSTQVYKEPLIATAKIKENEKEGIPHYMFDLVSLNDDYTLYDYQKDARKLLDEFIKDNKNIIVVGGSGLYIKALLYDYELKSEEKSNIDLSSYSNQELKDIADKIDPNNDIHINNRHRLERFINRFNDSGTIAKNTDNINKRKYDFILIGLKTDRETMYQKANDRVDAMFSEGLLDEAYNLYKKNYKNFTNIIGYRELNEYFNNKISLEDAKEKMKQNTRHYLKRQFTWFNNQMKDIVWFETDYNNFNNTIDKVNNYIKKIEES